MGQAHSAGEHRGHEDMIWWDGMHQIFGMRNFFSSLHLLIDPKMGAKLEPRLDHQTLLPQIPVGSKLQFEVIIDLACSGDENG